jgi:hypothetical protein
MIERMGCLSCRLIPSSFAKAAPAAFAKETQDLPFGFLM